MFICTGITDRGIHIKDTSDNVTEVISMETLKKIISRGIHLNCVANGYLVIDNPHSNDVVLDYLKRKLKSYSGYYACLCEHNTMEIRYWGDWENPYDAEDEEDYDWQVLSNESSKALRGIVNEVENYFKTLNIRFTTGEKNYIYFEIVNKTVKVF